jgi:hypothetical protein
MKKLLVFLKLTAQGGLLVMKTTRQRGCHWIVITVLFALTAFLSCSQRSVQSAGQGAVTGAAVGAVGGMVSALVFGGDVGEAAARGAVWSGSTGATAGAMSGAMAESNQKKAQRTAKLEQLRKKLGDDASQGLAALVECKHDIAQGYGRTAAKSDNPDYALAGLWLQVLAYADNHQDDQAAALLPELVAKDSKLTSTSQAEAKLQGALQKLMDIRRQYSLPKSCG